MPRTYPTYPSRAQVVEYLEGYAGHFRLQPVFNTTVLKVARDGSQWIANTNQEAVSAPVVAIAISISAIADGGQLREIGLEASQM